MKKIIIISIVIITLLAVSTAYAIWTDTVSIHTTMESAVVKLRYIDRTVTGNVTYQRQNGHDVSNTYPYAYIQETSNHTDYGASSNTVVYEIKNTGTVPTEFDGISVSAASLSQSDSYFEECLSVSYSVNHNGTTSSGNINDVTSSSYINFSNIVLNAGETCTLTVVYNRAYINTGFFLTDWIYNAMDLSMEHTNTPDYSVYN